MVGTGCTTAAVLLLAGLAVLPACGGGGEGPSRPASRIAPAGPEPGENTAAMPETGETAASARAASVLGGADGLFATSVHAEHGFGEREVADVACSGLACSGIGIGNAGRLAEAGVVGETGGVDLVSASDMDAGSWGGWMRHAGFGVLAERTGMGADLREFRYGLALGALTEVAEGRDVNAVWRGRMVGVTAAGAFADGRLEGEAELAYRSVAALGDDGEDGDVVGRIDAVFTKIASVSTGASFPDARFTDVPVRLLDVIKTEVEAAGEMQPDEEPEVEVTAKMAFDAGTAGNRIRGGFFGPDRAEAAGVFEQNGILGAFGAAKE